MSLAGKICGVTNARDAALVADAGADAIGINLFPGSSACRNSMKYPVVP